MQHTNSLARLRQAPLPVRVTVAGRLVAMVYVRPTSRPKKAASASWRANDAGFVILIALVDWLLGALVVEFILDL